jgi:hypothetical protein
VTRRFTNTFLLFSLYALLAFPLFYFVYKFGSPYLGMIDFFDYYKLYESLDFKGADSPLNMRLVGSFFVFLMNKAGLHYDTITQIDSAPFSKQIFFNAILFNYLCVVITCMIIYRLLKSRGIQVISCLAGGALYLLGFGTIFFELMPLTDALSVLLFALIIQFYENRSPWIYFLLLLLVFQREYIFFALAVMSIVDYFRSKDKYFLLIILSCIGCFLLYFILRKAVFETDRYSYQTNISTLFGRDSNLSFPLAPFIRQLLMTLNLFLIYIGLIIYKKVCQLDCNSWIFTTILLLFAQILLLTFFLGLGNNSGRYFYILSPYIIINIFNELKTMRMTPLTNEEG